MSRLPFSSLPLTIPKCLSPGQNTKYPSWASARTVRVLNVGTPAVAYDTFTISDIVGYPIDKSTAI